MCLKVITYYNESVILFSTYSSQNSKVPLQFCRDQSGVVKFYGSFAFNRKRNVLELEIKQDYTSPGTQKYVVRFFSKWPFLLLSSLFQYRKSLWVENWLEDIWDFVCKGGCWENTNYQLMEVMMGISGDTGYPSSPLLWCQLPFLVSWYKSSIVLFYILKYMPVHVRIHI